MNPINTFTKKIKEPTVTQKEINDPRDIAKLLEILGKLENMPGVMVSGLHEIGLRNNPQKWINSLIQSTQSNFPTSTFKDMENLLFDFTDAMMTRMREESKYALGLLTDKRLVLCHSIYGEETITPEWKIIPRMLDTDNILRFVSFYSESGEIRVKYWERAATYSFIDWLGLPRKQAFLFGGKFRICSEIDNFSVEFQLTEQEMDQWLNEHPEFKHGKIDLSVPIHSLSINEVRVGKKHYQDTEDFIQDYEAEKQGIPLYKKEYQKIKDTHLPLLMKYLDEETQVIRIEGDSKEVIVTKNNPAFEIIFADGTINLRASYLNKLARKILNGEALRIFHAGMEFSASPLSIGNTEFYNAFRSNKLTEKIIKYYNSTNLQDKNLDTFIKYTALKIVSLSNPETPLRHVLDSISDELITQFAFTGNLTKGEDKLLEFKSRDIMSGGDKKIINYLADDLNAKLTESKSKIYIVGVEDDGSFDPIPINRINSNRVETLTNGLKDRFPTTTIYSLPVTQSNGSLLIIIAYQLP